MPKTTNKKQFTVAALKAEQGRRKNNRARRKAGIPTVQSKSWVLPGLSGADITALLAGETVKVAFRNRDVTVTLKG